MRGVASVTREAEAFKLDDSLVPFENTPHLLRVLGLRLLHLLPHGVRQLTLAGVSHYWSSAISSTASILGRHVVELRGAPVFQGGDGDDTAGQGVGQVRSEKFLLGIRVSMCVAGGNFVWTLGWVPNLDADQGMGECSDGM